MHALALNLHGLDVADSMIGYSLAEDQSMLGVTRGKYIGTLGHELFHLMVRDRNGDIPPWLEEGIAALYETTNIAQKYLPGGPSGAVSGEIPFVGGELAIRGMPNWRGCILRKLWWEGFNGIKVDRPSIAELVQMDSRSFNNLKAGEARDEDVAQRAVNHATARYFMLYLQDQRDRLFSVYQHFAARDPFTMTVTPAEDAVAELTVELGPLDQVDVDFQDWLLNLLARGQCAQG
jgi:hypothetical protein